MAYNIEGRLLEICSCETICPCFVNQTPDNGACDVTVAWHIDKGDIEGVDVAGRTIAAVAHIPGKPRDGGWRAAVYLDENTSDSQQDALLNVFTGKLGGAIADVAKLIGEVVGVERAPITFESENGRGELKIGDIAGGEMEPFVADDGGLSTLSNTVFSGAPGSPAVLGQSPRYRAKHPGVGIDVELSGHNAVACAFRFQG
ncbi:MAG: DUF1326 domain-containing protein [Hyphomicrobiaceae bacterium]